MRTYCKIQNGSRVQVQSVFGGQYMIGGSLRSGLRITLEATHAQAAALFGDDMQWAVVEEQDAVSPLFEEVEIPVTDENGEAVLDEEGNPTVTKQVAPVLTEDGTQAVEEITEVQEYDKSEYSVAGEIVDHRDGSVEVYMGKPTELEEAYALLYGGVQ